MDESGWAVILTYDDDGHIDDSDAEEIDYDDMLKDMKEGTEDNNARARGGYQAVHLVGWAETPHYDAATKKLYWARSSISRAARRTRSTTTCACSAAKACCR